MQRQLQKADKKFQNSKAFLRAQRDNAMHALKNIEESHDVEQKKRLSAEAAVRETNAKMGHQTRTIQELNIKLSQSALDPLNPIHRQNDLARILALEAEVVKMRPFESETLALKKQIKIHERDYQIAVERANHREKFLEGELRIKDQAYRDLCAAVREHGLHIRIERIDDVSMTVLVTDTDLEPNHKAGSDEPTHVSFRNPTVEVNWAEPPRLYVLFRMECDDHVGFNYQMCSHLTITKADHPKAPVYGVRQEGLVSPLDGITGIGSSVMGAIADWMQQYLTQKEKTVEQNLSNPNADG